jgi:hypothetical protein
MILLLRWKGVEGPVGLSLCDECRDVIKGELRQVSKRVLDEQPADKETCDRCGKREAA